MKLYNVTRKHLSCKRMLKGYGFMHKCMSPEFLVSADGSLTCASCGKVYRSLEKLQRINSEGGMQAAA